MKQAPCGSATFLGLWATLALACGGGGTSPDPGPDAVQDADAAGGDEAGLPDGRVEAVAATLRLGGAVLDPGEKPLSGCTVAVLAATAGAPATTDAGGRFLLQLEPPDAPLGLAIECAGYLPAERTLAAGRAGRVELPPILMDPVAAVADVPAAGTVVTSVDGGVAVEVPAGAFPEGTRLALGRIPVGDALRDDLRLPAPVPEAPGVPVAGLAAVIVDAGGRQPAATLTVRVGLGVVLPAGTSVPVGRFDSGTGAWVDHGVGEVQADGRLAFQTDHLSTFAAALPAVADPAVRGPAVSALDRSRSPFVRGDPRIEPRSGAMQAGFDVPPLVRRDRPIGLSFFFDSRTLTGDFEVPVGLPDATAGETLAVRLSSPEGSARMQVTADAPAVADAMPIVAAAVRPAGEAAPADPAKPTDTATPDATTDGPRALDVEIRASRPATAHLAESASGSFTKPEGGAALATAEGQPIETPVPLQRGRSVLTTAARDVRRSGPFGPGWQLDGLTRLVQPWCRKDRVLLAGERDQPARVYGPVQEPFLKDHRSELAAAGLAETDIQDTRVARSAGVDHVLFRGRGEIWRRDPQNGALGLFAGGTSAAGESPDWASAENVAAARGGGVLVSSQAGVHRVGADGAITRLVGDGTTTGCDGLVEGGTASQAGLCGRAPPTLAQDPTSDRFVFSMLGGDLWEVKDDRLHKMRLKEGSPHWHHVAFDPKGTLYYSSDTGTCIYRHVDGLEDPLVLPKCRTGGGVQEGPVAVAAIGHPTTLATDDQGRLWFHDAQSYGGIAGAQVRRITADGEVESVTRPWAATTTGLAGVGGPLQDAGVAGVASLAPGDGNNVLLGGPGVAGFVEGARPPADALLSYGGGDGSVLTAQKDGSWLRILDDGTVETYDARGLLRTRGRAGEPPLTFAYARDWEEELADEPCGEPATPPRLDRIELAGETLFRFEYGGPEGRLSKVQDAAGRDTVWSPGGAGAGLSFQVTLPGPVTAAFRHDEEGRLVERRLRLPGGTDGTWTYEYDGERLQSVMSPIRGGRLIVAADGQVVVAPAAFSAARIATDARAREAVGVIPLPDGSELSVTVTDSGLRVTGPGDRTTRWDQDAWGRPTRRVAGDGGEIRMAYDEAGRLSELANVDTGETWTWRWGRPEDQPGYRPIVDDRLLERTDPRGRATRFQWDSAGRVAMRIDPNGGASTWLWETSGAAEGLVRRHEDPAGHVRTMDYDSHGNTKTLTDGSRDGVVGWTWRVDRDPVGRVTRQEDPLTGVTEYAWDEQGGLLSRRRTSADGKDLLEAWTLTRATTAAWESVGEPVPASAVLRAEDGEGRAWTEAWDDRGRRSDRLDPWGGGEHYEYDDAGRLTRRDWTDGSREAIEWDPEGRPWRRTFSGPAAGAGTEIEWDAQGRVVKNVGGATREASTWKTGQGLETLSVSPTGTTGEGVAFTLHRTRHDDAGETVRDLLGVASMRLRRGFDDEVESVTVKAQDRPGGYIPLVTLERDAARRITRITRANGVETVREYDALGRPAWQEERAPGGTFRIEWRYGVGPRPTGIVLGGTDRTYGWDGAGRLLSCSDTGETATWDRGSARTSSAAGAWTRDAGGLLKDDGTATREFDSLGRLTRRVPKGGASGVLEIRYGPGGLPSQALLDGVERARYQYDELGRRVERVTAEGAWHYGYLPDSNRPFRVREPSGREWMLVDAEGPMGFGAAVARDGSQRFVHYDAFRRVIGMSDETGAFVPVREECFGRPLASLAMSGPTLGFHGVPYDPETGLYAVGPRLYDPGIGEFLQPEPEGFSPLTGAYTYAGGDPVLRADPNGRFLEWALLGALAVGVGIVYKMGQLATGQNAQQVRQANEATAQAGDGNPRNDQATDVASDKGNRLRNAAVQGGEAAVQSTVAAGQAVTGPAQGAAEAAEAAAETAQEIYQDQTQAAPPAPANP